MDRLLLVQPLANTIVLHHIVNFMVRECEEQKKRKNIMLSGYFIGLFHFNIKLDKYAKCHYT